MSINELKKSSSLHAQNLARSWQKFANSSPSVEHRESAQCSCEEKKLSVKTLTQNGASQGDFEKRKAFINVVNHLALQDIFI